MSDALDATETISRQRAWGALAGRRLRWRFDVASGDPATALIAAARQHQATTIVVGGRSHGVAGALVVGSVAQKLVRHSRYQSWWSARGRPTTSRRCPPGGREKATPRRAPLGRTAMRKIILMMSVSVDGFFEEPNRELDWHTVDDELHRHFNEELSAMGAFLDGRVTYELMAGFWPTADADPSSTAPVAEFARIWRDMPKIVFSRTLQQADWNTTVVREVVADEIIERKAAPGGDMVLGGAGLAASFMRHDLIDEYRLSVHPVVIGRGKRLFPPSEAKVNLQFAETRTFGNGVVFLRYQ